MNRIKLAFAISVLLISNITLADLNTGLVAYWNFDDCTEKDNSGNGHDGVLFGSTNECVDSNAGNNAFLFNGLDNIIQIPTSSSFNIDTNVSYTVWVNPKKNGGVIFRKWISSAEDKSVFLGSNGKVGFYLFNCMAGTPLYSKSAIPLNKWSHVSATYDGNYAKIYVNGVLSVSTKTQALCNVSDNFGTFDIGGDSKSNNGFIQGSLDDIRVYNRTLNSSEVKNLYYQVSPPVISGKVAWETQHNITCQNITQGTSVIIPKTKASNWNCETSGLSIKSGDKVKVIIEGTRY